MKPLDSALVCDTGAPAAAAVGPLCLHWVQTQSDRPAGNSGDFCASVCVCTQKLQVIGSLLSLSTVNCHSYGVLSRGR